MTLDSVERMQRKHNFNLCIEKEPIKGKINYGERYNDINNNVHNKSSSENNVRQEDLT